MKTAFVFPGQGAQHPGMGKEFADSFAIARQTFEEANDALGFDLAGLCFDGPEEDLRLTANTQPAILATSVVALRVLRQECGLSADYTAGHSLGEYSALVCAGALDFADALRTVRQRGTFMQEAVPVGTGAMAAMLSIDAAELAAICEEAAQGEVVAPANFNSPGQIVIAGHSDAVNRAIVLAKERGYRKAMLLPVSAPFHCPLMQPAADRLAEVLGGVSLSTLTMPVVSNVEATPNQEAERVKDLLVAQVCAPVRWEESVKKMLELEVEKFVEIGPGKVLSGLVKRIAKGTNVCNVEGVAGISSLAE
ncbi:MAG: [acyl-carrier-protein] S-malonyltransferase [Desulfuromonas sp.]|nr:MAG: [acyl-carrier-protein] S-malonyltransferase [Desulfuromonas sp.]